MAHFAKLDENNIVIAVHVVHNNELLDENGQESEAKGVQFLSNLHGHTNWKQTSYNSKFRKNFAAIGFIYRADIDAFIEVQPHPSWSLDELTGQWKSPVALPLDGKIYEWDESTLSWIEIKRNN